MLATVELKLHIDSDCENPADVQDLLRALRENLRSASEQMNLPDGFKVNAFSSIQASVDYSDEPPRYTICYGDDWMIDGVAISDEVFDEIDYGIREREECIENLEQWIAEAHRAGRSDNVALMRNDLEFLRSINDEFVFNSRSTNLLVAFSRQPNLFNELCERALEMIHKG